MTHVFIAAPTAAMRMGLRSLLDAPGIEVVGDAASPRDHPDLARRADVLVVGEWTPAVAATISGGGAPAVVVLGDGPAAVRALAATPLAGWAVVARGASAAELQAAVMAAARGLAALPVTEAARLLGRRGPGPAAEPEPLPEPLTPREHEVLELLGLGLANREIARRLGISEHTAKFHVSAIYGKLGAQNRTEAVSRGARLGLVTL